LTERTIIITGASDGIGAAAARALHAQGNRVVIVGRSPEKTRRIAAELGVDYHVADFSRLAEVRTLAATLLEQYPTIDVLANNAGGIMGDRELTVDGHEKTFQINHLAPFLLTQLLSERLIASRATVINTSSVASRLYAKFDINDVDAEKKYSPNLVYGNAKLANILFTKELDRRYADQGISTAAFHPGVVSTSFAADSTSPMRMVYRLFGRFLLTPDKGADTLVWLATSTPGVDWERGGYYEKRKPATISRSGQDMNLAAALWERSEEMVAVSQRG
jgi:NAD(P)-dependent dehydrogenase (short-subunit alcohol dehydrogenase family)